MFGIGVVREGLTAARLCEAVSQRPIGERDVTTFSAPTGRHEKARGSAPGKGARRKEALKGRHECYAAPLGLTKREEGHEFLGRCPRLHFAPLGLPSERQELCRCLCWHSRAHAGAEFTAMPQAAAFRPVGAAERALRLV